MGILRVGLALALLALVSPGAAAMSFTAEVTPNGFQFLSGVGEIVPGDAERLEKLLFEGFAEERLIVLSSPGGSLWEGVALGTAFHNWGFEVLVAEQCYSACFVAYAGGEVKDMLGPGEVGMHQFSGVDMSTSDTQFSIGVLAERLEAFGVAAEALTPSLQTDPDDIYVFSHDELVRYGLIVSSDGRNFAEREAAALGISVAEYKVRRAQYMASSERRSCLQIEEHISLAMCNFVALQSVGLRR